MRARSVRLSVAGADAASPATAGAVGVAGDEAADKEAAEEEAAAEDGATPTSRQAVPLRAVHSSRERRFTRRIVGPWGRRPAARRSGLATGGQNAVSGLRMA